MLPVHKGGHSNASFPHSTLAPSQGPVAGTRLRGTTVVRGEDDDGVAQLVSLLQLPDYFGQSLIHGSHHGALLLSVRRFEIALGLETKTSKWIGS